MPEPTFRVYESPAVYRNDLLWEAEGFRHELLLDGEPVSRLLIAKRAFRIGGAVMPFGAIISVETEEKRRNRGYSRRVLEHSSEWMAANGYDCAFLFGIDNFYHRFGYTVCLPACRMEVRTRDAELAESRWTVRPIMEADHPALHAIYAANNADLTGSFVRDEGYFWFRKGSHYGVIPESVVFTDEAGEVVAYASRDATQEHVTVNEVGLLRPEHHTAVLRWAAERAIEQRQERITFHLPPESLFTTALTQYGAVQTLTFPRNGAGGGQILAMGLLLRVAPFFEKTLPEWTRRAQADLALAAGLSVRLETEIGAVTLCWTGEAVEADAGERASGLVRLPHQRLLQLAMGYYDADFALRLPDMEAQGDLRLFQTLFPRRLGHLWKTDQF